MSSASELIVSQAEGGWTVNKQRVNHLDRGEFNRRATIRKFRTVGTERASQVARELELDHLNAIYARGEWGQAATCKGCLQGRQQVNREGRQLPRLRKLR